MDADDRVQAAGPADGLDVQLSGRSGRDRVYAAGSVLLRPIFDVTIKMKKRGVLLREFASFFRVHPGHCPRERLEKE